MIEHALIRLEPGDDGSVVGWFVHRQTGEELRVSFVLREHGVEPTPDIFWKWPNATVDEIRTVAAAVRAVGKVAELVVDEGDAGGP